MSGELQVVFIYDRYSCRKEEDDPKEAILYFHPSDIAEERRIAICGQLMGITHFLMDSFSTPQILTLENGKFALRKFGKQYVLALGCSSITPDWLLEKQADILYSLTKFFHRDIQSILEDSNGDRRLLSTKLTKMMDHYIPVSQHHGDLFALTFGILPILYLPKSANSISLQASLLLNTCMMKKGVLGGIVMYQNKVVGVEIFQDLAQKLAFIQPYQLPPAEHVKVDFKVPPGVQIFTVYVSERELQLLKKRCTAFQQPTTCEASVLHSKEGQGMNSNSAIDPIREEDADPSDVSSSTGYSEASSSICFDHEHETCSKSVNSCHSCPSSSISIPECDNKACTLNGDGGGGSGSISVNSKVTERIESGIMSMEGAKDEANELNSELNTQDKAKHQYELNVHSHQCAHGNHFNELGVNVDLRQRSRSLGSIRTELQEEDIKLKKAMCSSLADPYFPYIICNGKSISKSLVESAIISNTNQEENAEMLEECLSESQLFHDCSPIPASPEPSLSTTTTENVDSTIVATAPNDNVPSSTTTATPTSTANTTTTSTPSSIRRPINLPLNTQSNQGRSRSRRWSTLDDMMSPINPDIALNFQVTPVCQPQRTFPLVPEQPKNEVNKGKDSKLTDQDGGIELSDVMHLRMMNSFRKLSSQEDSCSFHSSSENEQVYHPRANQKSSSASSSSSSTQAVKNTLPISARTKKKEKHGKLKPTLNLLKEIKAEEKYEKSCLYIYSHASMRLLLIMDGDQTLELNTVQALWECGSVGISELAESISNVEEQNLTNYNEQSDPYCYLRYEPIWKSLAHGGRNQSIDFDIVQLMHRDFSSNPNMSELIIRGQDHVVYGYQCVGSEVYYQQSANLLSGLPMPSDLMGKVNTKAKRRLERDHSVILL